MKNEEIKTLQLDLQTGKVSWSNMVKQLQKLDLTYKEFLRILNNTKVYYICR